MGSRNYGPIMNSSAATLSPGSQVEKPSLDTPTAPEIEGSGLGQLPALSVMAAVGLLLIAISYTAARTGAAWAAPLNWTGFLAIIVPIALRLLSVGLARGERISLVAVLGLGLYLAKLLRDPLAFSYHDELVHWRTAIDIASTGHLFHPNSMIPVSPLYPGLEIVTNAFTSLTGLSVFDVGIVLLGVGRLMLVLALYLFYEQITGDERMPSVATLLYMCNPSFVFFDAQFSYESFAVPLAGLVLFATAYRSRTGIANRFGMTVVVLLGIEAVVASHHLTSYTLASFLVLWWGAGFLRNARQRVLRTHADETITSEPSGGSVGRWSRRWSGFTSARGESDYVPWSIPLFAIASSLVWLGFVASLTIGYLSPVLGGAVTGLVQLIAGEAVPRQLFRTLSGEESALMWERVTALAGVGLILVGLVVGLVLVWSNRRREPLVLALAAVAITYPVFQGLRLTWAGAETSNRTSASVFVGLAFVLALGVTVVWAPRGATRARRYLVAGFIAVIFASGVIVDWPLWARMPGPYLVVADMRSIEPQGISTAQWAYSTLGPDNRIVADRINQLLMEAYGNQRIVTGVGDGLGVAPVLLSPRIGPAELDILRHADIRYVVVDHRLASGLPVLGIYVEDGEPDTDAHTTPLDPRVLAKFDASGKLSRIYDSGDITIYDVAPLTGTPQARTDKRRSCEQAFRQRRCRDI